MIKHYIGPGAYVQVLCGEKIKLWISNAPDEAGFEIEMHPAKAQAIAIDLLKAVELAIPKDELPKPLTAQITPQMLTGWKRRYMNMKEQHSQFVSDNDAPPGFFTVWDRLGENIRQYEPDWMEINGASRTISDALRGAAWKTEYLRMKDHRGQLGTKLTPDAPFFRLWRELGERINDIDPEWMKKHEPANYE